MKHAKLLKSVALSTVLLWGGATQAQTTGDMGVVIVRPSAAQSIAVAATDISFGSYTSASTAQTIVQACPTSGHTTTPSTNRVAAGRCGEVTVTTTSSANVNFTFTLTSAALALPSGGTNIAAPTLSIIDDDSGAVASGQQFVSSTSSRSYAIGGTVTIPANHGAGTYSAQYTFTATVS